MKKIFNKSVFDGLRISGMLFVFEAFNSDDADLVIKIISAVLFVWFIFYWDAPSDD